jgi:hypothetical protein
VSYLTFAHRDGIAIIAVQILIAIGALIRVACLKQNESKK